MVLIFATIAAVGAPLGTYRSQPAAGHPGMTIGIGDFRDPTQLRLDRMLTQPFIDAAGSTTINRRGSRSGRLPVSRYCG